MMSTSSEIVPRNLSAHPPRWRLYDDTSVGLIDDLLRLWEAQVSGWESPFAFHYSQEWFDVSRQTRVIQGARPELAVLYDGRDRPAGVVPLEFYTRELNLRLLRDYAIRLRPDAVISLMFGDPPFPLSDDALDALFHYLAVSFPRCPVIRIEGVPCESLVASHVIRSRKIRSEFFVYRDESNNWIHTIQLPGRFDDYLAKYSGKKRYNLRRQHRLLAEAAGHPLVLRRINAPQGVDHFLTSLDQLALTSNSSPVHRTRVKPPPLVSPAFAAISHELAGAV